MAIYAAFRKFIVFTLIAILFSSFSSANKNFSAKLSPEELKLYNLITEYRKSKNLPAIPLSKSLTYVAQQHCLDLYENKPDLAEECNAHSWSNKGGWTECCYTSDHKQAVKMWNKPGELTNYKGNGYEIACGSSKPIYSKTDITPENALAQWKGSNGHNNVIINEGVWKKMKWNAIGIGMYKNFAVVWFGTEPDAEGEPLKP